MLTSYSAASGNKTMAAFKALAAQAPANISPGQAPGGEGSSAPAPSGTGVGGAGGAATSTEAAGGAGGAATSTAAAGAPAQQTTNAAPGLYDASSQSLFGLTVGVFAAFFML